MRILAVDTTTARESVALVAEGSSLGEARLLSPDGHSRRLLPAIEFLLGSLGLTVAHVEGFAVTAGPGSFTGLRVGLSTVQGLALAAGRPCLAFSALDVLAARAAGAAPQIVALMDAYRGEVFAGRYDAAARPLAEAELVLPEPWLRALPAGCAFIGDGALRHHALIEAVCQAPVFPARSLFLAGTLGALAEPRLAAGEGVGPERLRPLYLREAAIRPPAP